mgnify:CR=1 FL=1
MKKIIEYLNNSSFFPYFIITPIPYAIGTAAIDILFGINKAKEKNKKLLIIAPSFGQKILNYQVCNDFLFDKILIENFSQERNFIRIFFSIFINLNLFFFRSISLIILKIFKARLKESYFFSFIGISQSYEDKVETKEKTIDDIKKIDFFYNKNPIHLSEKFKNDGSKILNNNTKCKHFNSTGRVLDINNLNEGMGKYITYEVLNDGPTYKKGDILKKTMDQITCLN